MSNDIFGNPAQANSNRTSDTVEILKTDDGAINGQNKCPKCGSTDISQNSKTGLLRCNFCRHEFAQEVVGCDTDIAELTGTVIGSGAQDIAASAEDILTLRCSSCGAEVVIDTREAMGARCHWCRNTLSVNQAIPNGSVPDMVLPFRLKKDDAKTEIETFVKKRTFFAHPTFIKEFSTQNIMGVYLPYMLVDVNAHANFSGQGEHLVRKYTQGSGDKQKTYYDANLYDIEREFDLTIDDLTVESSADKRDLQASGKTNNVINAIMPFDTENCVKWDANYLRSYTSEKRDTNIEQLHDLMGAEAKDIARSHANSTMEQYDRGVCWASEQFNIKGERWKAAYLPVWLYSYQELKGNGSKLLHYVAVNARSKKTMGSVPLNLKKLIMYSVGAEILGMLAMIILSLISNSSSSSSSHDSGGGLSLLLLTGFVYFITYYLKYRNTNARFKYEKDIRAELIGVQKSDVFVRKLTGLTNERMHGANNHRVSTAGVGSILENASAENIMGSLTKKDGNINAGDIIGGLIRGNGGSSIENIMSSLIQKGNELSKTQRDTKPPVREGQ